VRTIRVIRSVKYNSREQLANKSNMSIHTYANANVRTNNSCEQFASFALSNTIRANNWRINPIFDYFLLTICGRPEVGLPDIPYFTGAQPESPASRDEATQEIKSPYFNQDLSVSHQLPHTYGPCMVIIAYGDWRSCNATLHCYTNFKQE